MSENEINKSDDPFLLQVCEKYLEKLCVTINTRRVGNAGNQEATEYFQQILASNGFLVECPRFSCIDWESDGITLQAGDDTYPGKASPYSLGGEFLGQLEIIKSIEELEEKDISGKLILLLGEIVKEQLMPKKFPFYNPEEHQKIYQLLETKKPQAIIAATGRNWELAAALYPFPFIEDGDFDIPSIFMKDVDGERLASHEGEAVSLSIHGIRISSTGCNVVGRKGRLASKRIVIFAHIDSHIDVIGPNPGALDNAASVVVLMLLSHLLSEYDGNLQVELVALNGEDYYAASGEKLWLSLNQGQLEDIILGINMDGVGYIEGKTAYSLYQLPKDLIDAVREIFPSFEELVEGPAWYQSDHSLFIQNGIPAIALTTEQFDVFAGKLAHTPLDTIDKVDPRKLVMVALLLKELIKHLNRIVQ